MPMSNNTPKRISDALKETKPKRMGDTLDFYNDSMPRRAVEGLFDKADKPKPAEREPDGLVSGYGGEPEAKPVKKVLLKDDLEDNISIYSSKTRQARKRSFLDEPEPELPPELLPGRRRVPAVSEIDEEVGYKPGPNFLAEILARFDIESLPLLKIGAGVLVVIIIFVMGSFVIKINTVNARLAEANEKLAKVSDDSAEYQQMRIENDGLKQEIEDLKQENESLLTQLESSMTSTASDSPADTEPSAPPSSSANIGAEAGTYIVEPGDTLSKIAGKFYGNTGEYQRIMDANDLTNTNIFPGQPLRIPPK